MSHGASSFTGLGFMKPVSPWRGPKLVASPVRLFLRLSSALFLQRVALDFPDKPINLPVFSVQWGKVTFIFSEHMVTLFTYHVYTSIQYKYCVECKGYINKINIITTSKHRSW